MTTGLEAVWLKSALDLVSKQIEPFLSRLVDAKRGSKERSQLAVRTAFKQYYETVIRRCSLTKTILYRAKPVRLYDFYVDLELTPSKDAYISTTNIDFFNTHGPAILIVGNAGSGKSTLFKHLFLKTIELGSAVPLLVELRRFNGQSASMTLSDLLHAAVQEYKLQISRDVFLQLLSEGRFILFLDGYDELSGENASRLAHQINALAEQNSNVTIIVTSRPDPNTFAGWHAFTELSVVPLSKDKCLELITKLRYDAAIKSAFATAVDQRLYSSHRSFLQNPLLATLMLMTYEQFGSIDERMHVFYSQVFDTLYTKHDASKVGYRREMKCRLNSDDFRAILSAFCIQSYLKSRSTFSTEEALRLIEAAKDIAQISQPFESIAFLQDLTTSISIMVQDGADVTFAHRSLQEYFAACFILRTGGARRRELLQLLRQRLMRDDVAALVFGMDQGVFEDEFLAPLCIELQQKCRYSEGMSWLDAFANLLATLGAKLGLDDESWFLQNVDDEDVFWLNFGSFVGGLYGDEAKNDGDRSALMRLRSAFLTKGRHDVGGVLLSDQELRRADVGSAIRKAMPLLFVGFERALSLPREIVQRRRDRDDAIHSLLLQSREPSKRTRRRTPTT